MNSNSAENDATLVSDMAMMYTHTFQPWGLGPLPKGLLVSLVAKEVMHAKLQMQHLSNSLLLSCRTPKQGGEPTVHCRTPNKGGGG